VQVTFILKQFFFVAKTTLILKQFDEGFDPTVISELWFDDGLDQLFASKVLLTKGCSGGGFRWVRQRWYKN